MAKYVCLFNFGKFKKGDPFTGDQRTIDKLKNNGMITETYADEAEKELKKLEKKPVILSKGELLSSGSVLQAGQALTNETAQKSKRGRKKKSETANELE